MGMMKYSELVPTLFQSLMGEKRWIFFNNMHTTQVLDSIVQELAQSLRSGIVRTDLDSDAILRQKIAYFLHAETSDNIFFTDNAAGIIHWLAYGWGLSHLQDGDEVILSPLDSGINAAIFYQLQAQLLHCGISLLIREFGYRDNGEFDLEELLSLISARTRLIFVPHIHPIFGAKNEADIACLKQRVGDKAYVIVDLSQSIGRIAVDLRRLQCDGAFFSGRNLFSPYAPGIMYVKRALHGHQNDLFIQREMSNPLAGSMLLQSISLLERIGGEQIALHLQELSQYLLAQLRKIPSIEFLPGIGHCGTWCNPGYGIISFQLSGISAEECAWYLEEKHILVDPVVLLQYPNAITLNMHVYNTIQQIDFFMATLLQIISY
jgi:cysteine desulfurase / selenocysteine lyase